VAEFRRRHAAAVDYHAFLQFELEQQLDAAARAARAAGMEIGLYQDLPLGSIASGFDAWAFPELLVRGASLGAPPDPYAAQGQNWALPPLHPLRIGQDGYRLWRLLLRSALSHAGAVRIDHAMGLLRQFWIPAGRSGREGAYVRFPFDDLLGVLALESSRAGALVIGEDLGTVPAGFDQALARYGVLSLRVMFFERERRGAFKPARRYSPRALVVATTHDSPTLEGYWRGRDLEIWRELGLIASDAALRLARGVRARDRQALLDRLAAEGALPAARDPGSPAERCAAVHRFLCATPAPLVALSLDDLAGETEPVNVPGVSPDRYPSWTRRLRLPVERLLRDPDVARGLSGARARLRRRRV
jgi:4-alpha-glucanotransferase